MRRFLVTLVVAPLLAVVVALVGFAWRLSQGPIDLDFLRPRLEAALAPPGGAYRVEIGAVGLEWRGLEAGIELRASRVAAVSTAPATGSAPAAEATIATLPALALEIAPLPLLRGQIQVTRIAVQSPALRLVREADGNIDLGLGIGTKRPGASDVIGAELLADLDPDDDAHPSSPLATLRELHIQQATVELEDRGTGERWRAPGLDVEIVRDGRDVVAHLDGQLELGDAPIDLRGEARLHLADAAPAAPSAGTAMPDGAATGLDATLSARGVRPRAIAARLRAQPSTPVAQRLLDVVSFLERVDLELAATAHVSLDASWSPQRVSLTLEGGAGSIVVNPHATLPVKSVALELVHDRAGDRVDLVRLAADLTGPTLAAQGSLTGLSGPGRLQVTADITQLPAALAWRLWPTGVGEGARSWLATGVPAGDVTAAHVDVGGATQDGRIASLASATVAGTLSYRGLDVRFLPTLPAIRGVTGTGSFTTTGWKLGVTTGRLEGIAVGPASVSIDGVGSAKPRIAVQATVKGPVRDALRVLDRPPIEVGKLAGFPVERASGSLDGTLSLAFPLDGKDLGIDRLGLTARTRLANVAVPDLVSGWSLSDGHGTLDVDGNGLGFAGNVALAGLPLTVTWNEAFAVKASPRRTLEVSGSVDATQRKDLGFDLGDWVAGPVLTRLSLLEAPGKPPSAALALDLTPATIDVAPIGWHKAAGDRGQAHATLTLRSRAGSGHDGGIAAIDGVTIDAGNLTATGSAKRGPGSGAWQAITIDARIRTAGGEAPTKSTSRRAERAAPPSEGRVALRLDGEGDAYGFRVTSDDSGALFRAIGTFTKARGGSLTITGTAAPTQAGQPIQAHAEVRDFVVTEAPWLARLAGLASLQGVQAALMGGSGVPFDVLSLDLARRAAVLTISDGRVAGPTLGLTIAGSLDQHASQVDFTGTVIPSLYGLNRALGKIPGVRWLAPAGREAPIGMDFSITGSPGDPRVTVHPLDSITPSVLQGLLGLVTGGGSRTP